jgi:hypothetical protein
VAELRDITLANGIGRPIWTGPEAEQIAQPDIAAAVAELRRAQAARTAAHDAVTGLRAKLAGAKAQDAAELVDALDAGRKQPTRARRTAVVESQIGDAERLAAAHDELVRRRFTALRAALNAHQAEWAELTAASREEAREALTAALAESRGALSRWQAMSAMDRFAHGGQPSPASASVYASGAEVSLVDVLDVPQHIDTDEAPRARRKLVHGGMRG